MREVRLLDDTKLLLHDAGEMLSDHIARTQDYFEKEILEYMADKYSQHEVILDIGANIGNHTAYFAQYLENSAIIAFEPVQDNFALLSQNVRHYPNVMVRREAVGRTRRDVYIQINRSNMGACEVHLDITDARDNVAKVPQVRVDDLLLIKPVTLIKIDVEWYEPEVLLGAKAIMESDKPLILVEDAKMEYAQYFPPEYELLEAWIAHKTYLYGVPNA